MIKFTIRGKLYQVMEPTGLKLPRRVISACVAGMLGFPSKNVDHRHVPIASRLTGMCPRRRAEGKRKLKETSGNRFLVKDYGPEVLNGD